MDPAQVERLGGAAEWTHPAEILEPDEETREHRDRVRLLQVLSGAVTWIHRAENARVGAWQVTYALGLNQATRSMMEVAAELGVERATISSGAVKFLHLFDPPLPPSPAMRSEAAGDTYRKKRISKLNKNHANNGNHKSAAVAS